ncbi:HpcH/HpaI aldolase/citrate lyase family protein [Rhodobacter sp. KR11]|uniref:HpcH/HpaI aldolase family protein n=1 Tax=Rhodobacter sp. KR11 TaxID=2974588 RepID=UPI0022216DC3|nr:HpcH/HpaI aldolase/citrate lyase family protein [Rhodobacter sp. KR11]MCW1917793.1 HpcH/HpaI aldolase/citrate lyase family protein [Rhodobacter sp. KR11]
MPAAPNRLKARLAAGETVYGSWLGMADPYVAEMAGTCGFDWLLIDGEHAPNDLRSISAQLAVLRGGASDAVVRVPVGEAWLIKQMLDAGAQSLMVPMVETGAQAQAVYQATRYPGAGVRGIGSSLARASMFSAVPDYLTTADDQICLILQVESLTALENLDDILKVPADCVFVGPSDLAADMGHLGGASHPEVKAKVLETLARIKAAGRAAGILTTEEDYIAEARQAGARFIGVAIDVLLYVQAMRTAAARFK